MTNRSDRVSAKPKAAERVKRVGLIRARSADFIMASNRFVLH